MSKKRKVARRLVNFIVGIALGVCIFLGAFKFTYALINQDMPDVIVKIDRYGNVTQSGDMYAGTLWYPGFSKSGIIRLENNFRRIKVADLYLDVELKGVSNDNSVYDSFVNNMFMTISRGSRLVFDDILVDHKSLSQIMSNAVNADSSAQDGANQFYIEKGDSADLKYDLLMHLESGEELENLSANLDFSINMNEIPNLPDEDDDDDNDRDNDDRDNNDKKDKLIEEPLDVIPSVDGHWAHDCIVALIENDILDPDSVSRIRPDDYITRAEAAVLMGRALKLEESTDASTGYIDSVPTWAKGYVIATTNAKVFKGYPGKIFKSYGNISREEMTAVLIRAFREDSASDKAMGFIDKDTIARWSRGNVAKSAEEGIVTGYTDKTFRPRAYMTRAEAFTIVCKLLGYHELHNKKL